MKSSYTRVTLLVIVYCVLVLHGVWSILFSPSSLMQILRLIVDATILAALFLLAGPRALRLAIAFCWVKMALGAVLVLLGAWQIITLNVVGGLLIVTIGLIAGIGLAYWTLKVLLTIAKESKLESA